MKPREEHAPLYAVGRGYGKTGAIARAIDQVVNHGELAPPDADDFCDAPTHPSVRVQPRPQPRSVFAENFALGGLITLGACAVAYGAYNSPADALIAMFGFASVLTAALVLTGSVR